MWICGPARSASMSLLSELERDWVGVVSANMPVLTDLGTGRINREGRGSNPTVQRFVAASRVPASDRPDLTGRLALFNSLPGVML